MLDWLAPYASDSSKVRCAVATAVSSRFTPTFFVGAPVLQLAPLAQHKPSKKADSEKIRPIFYVRCIGVEPVQVPCERKTNTYNSPKVMVGTTKKSIETISAE